MTKVYVLLAILALAAVHPMAAQAELPFTIYGQLGFAKMMESGAPGGSIGIGAGMIYMFENSPFGIGGELGYLMLGKEGNFKFSAIPVTAQGYYMIPVQGTVAPYLEAGAGFYNSRSKYDGNLDLSALGIDDSHSSTDLGINLGGGIKFGNPDAKVRFGADLRYHIVMTDVESTSLLTVFGRVYY